MTTKPRFTLQQHRDTARDLYHIRDRLVFLARDVGNAYPVSAKAHRRAFTALRAVDDLRSALDDELFREGHESGDEKMTRVYYPGSGSAGLPWAGSSSSGPQRGVARSDRR